jgi:hypothetical protein
MRLCTSPRARVLRRAASESESEREKAERAPRRAGLRTSAAPAHEEAEGRPAPACAGDRRRRRARVGQWRADALAAGEGAVDKLGQLVAIAPQEASKRAFHFHL